MKKKLMMTLACALSVVGVLLVGAAALVLYTITSEIDKTEKKYAGPKVIGLPADYNPHMVTAAYNGPHPAMLERKPDPFNYPIKLGEIGPKDPLFDRGAPEYPFLCELEDSVLGQPIVDNQEGAGMAVYAEDKNGKPTQKIIGYSKDCLFKSHAWYYYNRKGTDEFYPLEELGDYEIGKAEVNGREISLIVRVEAGTINRFLYMIAALHTPGETLETPSNTFWNGRLIYGFRGGVGIGKRQGDINPSSLLKDHYLEFKEGYGFAYSSANQTSNHYNIWLAEDTVARVKRQFTALYGKPLYTVGVGGSGGAIQQYLIAQNNPDLINAALALYSYPDMVTQTIYALDCDLMEYYFDVTAKGTSFWQNWNNRQIIEGLNSRKDQDNPLAQLNVLVSLSKGELPNYSSGISECAKSWRGPTQVINNPRFVHFALRFNPAIQQQVNWTHWDNLKYFYGTDQNGLANATWDNIGVQYGLNALKSGQINIASFLDINAHIGGWKSQDKMKNLKLWYYNGNSDFKDISLWSEYNMNQDAKDQAQIAQRTPGNVDAIHAAYRSGHVFIGRASIPIIDLRHYLDTELDMHHSFATFSTRKRMIEYAGHADNQIIWMTEKPHSPIHEAFTALDHWMMNIIEHPEHSVVDNKPADLEHTCFDHDANVVAKGATVWDGPWNGKPAGKCLKRYPSHNSSRTIAGGDLKDDIFKCKLEPIEDALQDATYGSIDMSGQIDQLKKIFPNGVCNYSEGDAGKPDNLIPGRNQTIFATSKV